MKIVRMPCSDAAISRTPRRGAYRPGLFSAAACVALSFAGCKSAAPPVTDAALVSSVQGSLSSDSAISGQPVQVGVQNGVVTLTGTVSNDAQRTLAARDAAGVGGVTKVINDLTVATPPPATATAVTPPPAMPQPVPARKSTALVRPEPVHQPAPIERPNQAYNPPQSQAQQQPTQVQAPPPPQQPTFRTVTVASGSTIPVRVTQTLDSATTQQGASFSGVVASDIVIDGLVAIPAGSSVSGTVDAVQEAAHFKGSSLLTVSLSSISRRGDRIPVTTDPYTVQGKGRGVNTAEKAGGGAAVGAILGGIFGGGKGAAIGAAAGGGVGAGSQAVTRGQQVQIASESVVRFHLGAPITVRVRTDAAGERHDNDGQRHDNDGQRRDSDGSLQPRQ